MDIADAFSAENIQAAGAVLDEKDVNELRQELMEYFAEQWAEVESQIPDQDDSDAAKAAVWLDIALHAFMAGRTIQMAKDLEDDAHVLPVHMNLNTMRDFIEFLQTNRGEVLD